MAVMVPVVTVVPLVGTWIEIKWLRGSVMYRMSCPSWARGLKFAILDDFLPPRVVPLVGTWIEISIEKFTSILIKSCPSWARGLKFIRTNRSKNHCWSCPSWARGLKYYLGGVLRSFHRVVPLVGTWIEI